MRKAIVLAGLVIILAAVNWQIAGKERVLRDGAPMLLQLAPVDPRSLMQGDYMRLDYAIARGTGAPRDWPRDGQLVVTIDADGVAQFVRRQEPGAALAPDERLLRYRRRDGRVRIGTDAFFFQEGDADRYSQARYGELRVDADGDGLLIGLRDAERRPLPLEKPADARSPLP
jgi:uncharacterized membrane-anchored protein